MKDEKNKGISVFQRYLTIWVFLCMTEGILVGKIIPVVPERLNELSIAGISVPIAILIWIMIYPMMMKVDFESIKQVGKNPKGLVITWIVNWLIKPFTMYGISYIFLFIVFRTWIEPDLATNDLIILIAFVPIVKFLLKVSNVTVPYITLFASVLLFVVIPLAGGIITRLSVIGKKGREYFEGTFVKKFDNATIAGLLLTLVLIFSSQTEVILSDPVHILLIAVPLIIQTFFIFFIAYGVCRGLKLTQDIAAPAGMIGASNFFELAVAVAIALFGTTSPAALATTVGVLTEVPVMLTLVKIANKSAHGSNKDQEL